MKYCLALLLLLILGCNSTYNQTTYYLRSDGIRPGMSRQDIVDMANNIPNCILPNTKLKETTDYIVYRMYFIDGSSVNPYLCTFLNDSTSESQILQSIEYDQVQRQIEAGQRRNRANMIMMERNMMQQNLKILRPFGR